MTTTPHDTPAPDPGAVFEEYGEFVICRQPGNRHVAVGPEPGWVSPELRQVLRAHMIASVTGRCPGCGLVRDVPAEAKTHAGNLLFLDLPLRHGEDCPHSDFMLRLLSDRDCPGPEVDMDVSDGAVAPLLARLREITAGTAQDSTTIGRP